MSLKLEVGKRYTVYGGGSALVTRDATGGLFVADGSYYHSDGKSYAGDTPCLVAEVGTLSPGITPADTVPHTEQSLRSVIITNVTPGVKLDQGKPSVCRGVLQYFPRALEAIATLSDIGAAKYSWKGWEAVPDGYNRYSDAMGRHLLHSAFQETDPETGVLEDTAVAWNALARLELKLRGTK